MCWPQWLRHSIKTISFAHSWSKLASCSGNGVVNFAAGKGKTAVIPMTVISFFLRKLLEHLGPNYLAFADGREGEAMRRLNHHDVVFLRLAP